MAVRIDLTAFKRVTFGGSSGDADIVIVGYDWSLATFAMQVRAAKGDTGTPLVSLTTTPAGAQGLSAVYLPQFAMPDTGEITIGTLLRPQIDIATLAAIPLASSYSRDLPLWYDIHVQPVGVSKFMLMHGEFNLDPGVTL